ncbi:hypothetical protein ACFL1B_03220 [Nanoarchaeota archaeon]
MNRDLSLDRRVETGLGRKPLNRDLDRSLDANLAMALTANSLNGSYEETQPVQEYQIPEHLIEEEGLVYSAMVGMVALGLENGLYQGADLEGLAYALQEQDAEALMPYFGQAVQAYFGDDNDNKLPHPDRMPELKPAAEQEKAPLYGVNLGMLASFYDGESHPINVGYSLVQEPMPTQESILNKTLTDTAKSLDVDLGVYGR